MIIIVDFGSQTTHLIARRIRDLGVKTLITEPDEALETITSSKPKGIILSGGPGSVYEKNAPMINKQIFTLGIPVLGICYGMQLITRLNNGKVTPGKIKEYGPAMLEVNTESKLFTRIPDNYFSVWMSHGDEVVELPKDFSSVARTHYVKFAAIQNEIKNIYAIQFHPEVKHTRNGILVIKNFLCEICKLEIKKTALSVSKIINDIKLTLGKSKAVVAVSGGVDSTVAAALVARAIGDNLVAIYIDNGLMRFGTKDRIVRLFKNQLRTRLVVVEARKQFMDALSGVTDPEQKRKIIGELYIRCFERVAVKHPGVKYLVQGTIYSDVIESQGTKHSDKIKSHHNVGGLPEYMDLKLYEPLRDFYKDEVRLLGKKLGLSEEITGQQPFPGPGQAIRIIGEVTPDRLQKQQQADQIILEEMTESGWIKKVFQSFPVMTNTKSTAVKGDNRFYGEVVALRVYGSVDIMTASWSPLPYKLLQKISSRIVNEVPGISRVVYDITTKPPATMEWE